MAVGVVFVPESIPVAADALGAVQRDGGAVVLLHGVGHLALPSQVAGQAQAHGHAAGVLNVIAPNEEIPDGQPGLFNGGGGEQQRHKGGLLHQNQPVAQQLHVLVEVLLDLLPVHLALGAVRPQHGAGEKPVIPAQNGMGGQQLGQTVRVGQGIVVHDPHQIVPGLHGPAHSEIETAGPAEVGPGAAAVHPRLVQSGQVSAGSVGAGIVHNENVAHSVLLAQQSFDALGKQFFSVVGYDHGGHTFHDTGSFGVQKSACGVQAKTHPLHYTPVGRACPCKEPGGA